MKKTQKNKIAESSKGRTSAFEAANEGSIPSSAAVKIVEVPKKELKGIDLYRALKEAGFPQGGQGNWYVDDRTGEKFYIPQPSEIYQQFIGDPLQWQHMVDSMARAWIEHNK